MHQDKVDDPRYSSSSREKIMEDLLKQVFVVHHGKISNFDLISRFKSYFEEIDDQELIASNKRQFKKLVNKLAQVQVDQSVKYLVLRDRYRQELGLLSDADGLSASILRAISQSILPKPAPSTAEDVDNALFPEEIPKSTDDVDQSDIPHASSTVTSNAVKPSEATLEKKETIIDDIDPAFIESNSCGETSHDSKLETVIDDVDPKFAIDLPTPSSQVCIPDDPPAAEKTENVVEVLPEEGLGASGAGLNSNAGVSVETLIDDVDPAYSEVVEDVLVDSMPIIGRNDYEEPCGSEPAEVSAASPELILPHHSTIEAATFAVPEVPSQDEAVQSRLNVVNPHRSSSASRSVSELPSPAGSTTSSATSLSTVDSSVQKLSVRDRAEQFHKENLDARLSRTFGLKGKKKFGDDNLDSASQTSSSQISYYVSASERKWMLLASRCDYQEMAKVLHREPGLAAYADIINGQTALHWAAKKGKLELIKLLAGTFKVDPNIRSHAGYTPLHMASMFDQKDAIDLLCTTYRANQNLQDYTGRTAEEYRRNAMNTQKLSIYQLYDQVKRHGLYGNSQLCKNPSGMNQFAVCADYVSSSVADFQLNSKGNGRFRNGSSTNDFRKASKFGDGHDDGGLRSYDAEPSRLRVHSSVDMTELGRKDSNSKNRKERGLSVASIQDGPISPRKPIPTSFGLGYSQSFTKGGVEPLTPAKMGGGRPLSEYNNASMGLGRHPSFHAGWEIPEESVSPMHTISSETVEARLKGSPGKLERKADRKPAGRLFSMKPPSGISK